jgi:hypothetical protein
LLKAFVVTLALTALTACAESHPCYQLTGSTLAQCEVDLAARVAAHHYSNDDDSGPSNPNGGYQDTNSDNTVVRDDGTEIITQGTLTDVDTDTGKVTVVETGTVTTTPNETGPSTTNDTNPGTPSEKIESERDTAVTTTVNTGTVTTTPNETGPSTTNDTNPGTPSEKIERGTGDTDAGNDTGFGAESSKLELELARENKYATA